MTDKYPIRVYARSPWNNYQLLEPVNRDDWPVLECDGRPRGKSWRPVAMRHIKISDRGGVRKPSDFPYCECNSLVMNERAMEILKPHVEKYGEFLPLRADEGRYYLLNVTHLIDALDEDASSLLRSPTGGYILMVKKYAFKESPLKDAWIFKVPQTARVLSYVTQPFVDLVRSSGITGNDFRLLWSTEG